VPPSPVGSPSGWRTLIVNEYCLTVPAAVFVVGSINRRASTHIAVEPAAAELPIETVTS